MKLDCITTVMGDRSLDLQLLISQKEKKYIENLFTGGTHSFGARQEHYESDQVLFTYALLDINQQHDIWKRRKKR